VAKTAPPFLAAAAEQEWNARALGKQIKDQYSVVDRITQELQVAVMDVRMLPMSVVFARFPRMIRDLARSLGKQVVLEQEGQVTYIPRRGYFVTELRIEDLKEIYALRELLESRAAAQALPSFDEDGLHRIELADRDCVEAAEEGDVAAELEANRRFHFALLESPEQTHTTRLIRLLWDSTEAYRAMYYNSPVARAESVRAHERILAAIRNGDGERLIAELDAHRDRALQLLSDVLAPPLP
jgi:Transcriptional regulators